MANITAYGTINEGKLTLANKTRFQQDLKSFKDCAVELIIKKKSTRSTPQNRYYWGVVVKEIQVRLCELGNEFDADTVHDFLKDKFNKTSVIGQGGEVLDYFGASTSDMNKEEFMDYIDKIIEWAAEFLSIYIPLPNADLQLQF